MLPVTCSEKTKMQAMPMQMMLMLIVYLDFASFYEVYIKGYNYSYK